MEDRCLFCSSPARAALPQRPLAPTRLVNESLSSPPLESRIAGHDGLRPPGSGRFIAYLVSVKRRPPPRLSDLEPIDENDCVNVVVETARDSRTKLAYDSDRDAFIVKKVLPQGMSFP